MKNRFFLSALIAFLLFTLQSCAAVAGIFKAGAVTGVIIVVILVALIIAAVSGIFRKK
ncbi:MAG: hypothetical protein ACXVPU_14545 [Bacteroidia bacterium]